MSEQPPPEEVEVVKAEVVANGDDEIEVTLDMRITRLEQAEADQEKTIRSVTLGMIGLQEASLKHSVALGLLLAVMLFIAARALGV